MTEPEVLERLTQSTYVVEHNPNCLSPFLVRLPGKKGYIDKMNSGTADICGYGRTLVDAAGQAFVQRDAMRTFDRVMSNPDDPNHKIIAAYVPAG